MNNYANTFHDARVLITGGLGFVGSTLARRLVDLGAQITLVDSLIPIYGGNLRNVAGIEDRVKINIADVRDEYSMDYLVQQQDFLFNLAGQTSHIDSMRDPYTDLEINCRAQLSILEACRKHNPGLKLVYASTRQIYGKPDYLPVDERHPLHPVDVNGIAIGIFEIQRTAFHHTEVGDEHPLSLGTLVVSVHRAAIVAEDDATGVVDDGDAYLSADCVMRTFDPTTRIVMHQPCRM